VVPYLERIAVQALGAEDGVPDAVFGESLYVLQLGRENCWTYSHCKADLEEVPKVSSQ
jgi:hypothetical protein